MQLKNERETAVANEIKAKETASRVKQNTQHDKKIFKDGVGKYINPVAQ